MDEKTANQIVNLLATIEQKLSSVLRILEEKKKKK